MFIIIASIKIFLIFQINELYDLLTKTEGLNQSIKPITERLIALKSLHVEGKNKIVITFILRFKILTYNTNHFFFQPVNLKNH